MFVQNLAEYQEISYEEAMKILCVPKAIREEMLRTIVQKYEENFFKTTVRHVQVLAQKQGISYDKTMEILDVPKDSRERIHNMLAYKQEEQHAT